MNDELQETWDEYVARKRAELEESLQRGEVHDPISAIFTIATLKALAISAAVSTASYFVARAFAPKPPRQQLGKLSGTLQLQNSEQGIFIPEIYGAGPTISLTAGSNPTYQNLTNVTSGAGGALTKTSGANNTYNAGASHNTAVSSGDAFLKVTPGIGWASAGFFNTASPTGSGGDATGCIFGVQWGPDGSVWGIVNAVGYTIATWETGDVFRIELRSGRFYLYKNSAALTNFNTALAIPAYPMYLGVIAYTTNAGVSEAKVQIGSIGDAPNQGRGGVKVPAIIIWSSGIRKLVTTTQQPTQGGKGGGGGTQTVENITYDIDLGMMFANRGPYSLIREYANADILIDNFVQSANPSGVYDSTVGADSTYDPAAAPDPKLNYHIAFQRVDGDIPYDGFGVGTGTIQGGGSQFAIYPGNTTQEADPTIEAAIDGQYGTGSTPAYRRRCYIVHKNFSLSRWSGIVPNITSVWEHQSLKNLSQIYGSFCERAGIAGADYDFTGIATLQPRGMLIAGRPFAPAEVMASPEIQTTYNYFVTEREGQIVGIKDGDEPTVTIADTEIGWLEGDAELPDIAPEVESTLAAETTLPREVVVKYIDPDNDWDANTQLDKRQITDGQSVELLEVQLALLADEARAVAQRHLYKQYVGGSVHKFTLPWTYLYLYPGYKITLTRAEGFTHTLRLTSISGGVGLLECEAVAIEPAAFTQPANGVFPPGWIPPQPIPSMTIVQLLDTPILRDGDVTSNDGVGRYFAGVPRTGVNQTWQGFALYIKRRNDWEVLASSNLPATVGTVVSVSDLYASPEVVDITFTVDSTTDVFTSTGNYLADGDEVTVKNSGGALPSPLVAGTSYFVRDKSGDTFKLAATAGGAAIDITTNGTGTNSINVGKITVDLYGTTATLSSVTVADIQAGQNMAVAGQMVFNFATATQVAGFPNRWTLTVLLTGQRDTEDKTASVAAGNRFVLINDAVKFAPMLVSDVDQSLQYRAVTAGQSLGDAATITDVWTGNSLRPFKVDSVELTLDGSHDLEVQFEGNPRKFEEPETYSVEVWPTTARTPTADIKRTLTVTAGASHSALLYAKTNPFSGEGTGKKTVHIYKNNALGGQIASVEWIDRTNSRIDFGLHWQGADGAVGSITAEAWLYSGRSTVYPYTTPLLHNVSGVRGIPVIGVRWSAGTNAGTIKESFYKGIDDPGNGAVTIGGDTPQLILERDNVDPGYGTFRIQDTDTADAGRPGPRYSFQLAGTEFRIYRNYNAALAQPPICVIPAPAGAGLTGMGFPLGLLANLGTNFTLRNVVIGAAARLSTIYALREQIRDFGKSATVDNSTDTFTSTAHGFANDTPVYVDAQTMPGGLGRQTIYYVRDTAANTFKLAATVGGAAINITSNGTAVMVAARQDTFHLRLYQNAKFVTVTKGLPVDVDSTIV